MWRLRLLDAAIESHKHRLKEAVLAHLRTHVEKKRDIGIESRDRAHEWQLLAGSAHETLSAAKAADSLWVFVYEPDDDLLKNDGLKLITNYM